MTTHRGDSVTNPELGPVFVVTGAKQPESCDDVSIRRSSIGLFAAAASGDGYDVTVKVVDSLGTPSKYESPYVTVTRNEILTGLNTPRFVLGLVEVSPRGPENDNVRYLRHPFTGDEETYFDMTSVNFTWDRLWGRSNVPS